ncbi:hypothetical protein, partial [Mesorhizobium sp. M1E.F.Ca.ET.041.01.1.1]|uniref:hypothetical protein n=1 Tax=Mesorhizobium sp. M1E.F.Ca.ET.041.01.1.1 TaxID=2496759 RepID=UPI001AED0B87
HNERAGLQARLFHVKKAPKSRKKPGIPRFSAWVPERFFLKSVSCRMSRSSGFLMEGNFDEQERTGVRRRRLRKHFEG